MTDVTEPYKNSCDHCGVIVDKKYWTFNLNQCVVCPDAECKEKQKIILQTAMEVGTIALAKSLGLTLTPEELEKSNG